MPDYVPISREAHANKRWLPAPNYAFAAREAMVPVFASELSRATLSLPLAFVPQEGHFAPVAVLGLASGKNLFVAKDGRWAGNYVPAILRGYPFALAQAADGQQMLCIDKDSGLLVDGPGGDALFDEAGAPSASVKAMLEALSQTAASRPATRAACDALQSCQLIVPWVITLQGATEQQRIDGLFRVDEAALNRLDDTDFCNLRRNGALLLAYCQLLSMQHLPALGQLAQAHEQVAQKAAAAARFLGAGDTISFKNLE